MARVREVVFRTTELLVLGAGLAGLRAAWSALEARPGLEVAIVSAVSGPGGSSFANPNDALGMQVCFTDADREAFVREARALAPPGEVNPALVELLAAEGEARLDDLRRLGIAFHLDDQGNLARYPGCFSPGQPRAVMFSPLAAAFGRFYRRVEALGGQFLPGWVAGALVVDDRAGAPVCGGAVLISAQEPLRVTAVRARAVVAALGGPAPLFAWNLAGSGTPGFSYGLLARAGVRLINTPYLQVMWAQVPQKRFWPLKNLATPGLTVYAPGGRQVALPAELRSLVEARGHHCPAGYGMEDGRLDSFLAENLHENGIVEIRDPVAGRLRVAPMAHAGNGGARIDARGQTTVRGLGAAGECASGMHGANRLGGAMVLATQVFGHRAGKYAAAEAREGDFMGVDKFTSLVNNIVSFPISSYNRWQAENTWLAEQLQRTLWRHDRSTRDRCRRALQQRRSLEAELFSQLSLETGLRLVGDEYSFAY